MLSFSAHCSIGSRAANCPMLSHIGMPGDGGGVGGGDGLGDGGGGGGGGGDGLGDGGGGDGGGGDGEAEGGGDGVGDGGGDGGGDGAGGREHPMQIGTYPLPEDPQPMMLVFWWIRPHPAKQPYISLPMSILPGDLPQGSAPTYAGSSRWQSRCIFSMSKPSSAAAWLHSSLPVINFTFAYCVPKLKSKLHE